MRAVWVGLAGAMLAVGAAVAGSIEYVGKGGAPASKGYDWDLSATLTPKDGGNFAVRVLSTNRTRGSCASFVEGVGVRRGDVMTVTGECSLTMKFSGQSLSIVEGKDCSNVHGSTCTYDGVLRRKK